ncbi:unnamed protein product [Mytilus coruscus]|uniref:Uncharacterized protein n=1 Tax=Mytilus coruscus TaxID=42192 RepID=A0A6J7ZWC4_MYTCO|nr:unnamed protein product [Mytilus coruscus]
MPIFVIRIKDSEGREVLPSTEISFAGGSFVELFTYCVGIKRLSLSSDNVTGVYLKESMKSDHIAADNADMDVLDLTTALGCKFIEFIIRRTACPASESSTCTNFNNNIASASNIPSSTNAFNILMGNRTKIILPDKPKTDDAKKLSGPQRPLCHIIDLMESKGCDWTLDCLDTANFFARHIVVYRPCP